MKSLIALTLMSASLSLSAQTPLADPKTDMEAKTITSSVGHTIAYRIYTPAVEPNQTVPLVLFLHGAGERGNNNVSQLVHGVKPLLQFVKEGHPAVIIAPQCPVNEQWVNTPWNGLSHTMDETPSKALQAVIELFEDSLKTLPIDRTRLYVTGISMGGYGTWDLLQRFPNQFAAAMPVCGGGDTNLAARLSQIPLHVVHGGSDGIVPVFRSRSMVEAIQKAGSTCITYVEHEGAGHDVWTRTYNDRTRFEWLFSHQKKN